MKTSSPSGLTVNGDGPQPDDPGSILDGGENRGWGTAGGATPDLIESDVTVPVWGAHGLSEP